MDLLQVSQQEEKVERKLDVNGFLVTVITSE